MSMSVMGEQPKNIAAIPRIGNIAKFQKTYKKNFGIFHAVFGRMQAPLEELSCRDPNALDIDF